MVTPFTLALASLDLMTTDCRSPRVIKVRLAEYVGPSATRMEKQFLRSALTLALDR
jgi:hypothetical protein